MQGHTAFNTVAIVEKLQLKIEAIEIWGRRLVVGTQEGVLLIYDIVPRADDPRNPFHVSVSDTQKNFSKKPITQLAVVEKYNLLISLSDGLISIHDLPSFALKSQLVKSKGCHLFAVDTTKPQLTLCVALKKKLIIYQLDNNDWTEVKELPNLTDVPRTVVWCGNNLCVGFSKVYAMLHVQSGQMTELFQCGKGGAVATLLPNDQVLLSRDDISIFIGYDGKSTRKFGLSWSETPICLGHYFPYVIAILSKFLEVRTTFGTQTLVQTIPLRAARFLAIKDDIYVAAQNQIWRLLPVPIVEQIDQLVRDRDYEEALALCEHISGVEESLKNQKRKMIKNLFAYNLFADGHYARAMEYFQELDVDPLQVIGLYQTLLPRELRLRFSYPIDIPDVQGAAADKAYQALINYLTQIRPTAIPNPAARNEDDYSLTTDLAQIIDTSLLKAYLKTNDALVMNLVKIQQNHCHVKECEKILTTYAKHAELVQLYKTKGMHRAALELLAKLGQGPRSASALSGPQETIKYLRELTKDQLPLLLEFSKWVLVAAPKEALQIFTEKRKDPLPVAQVLAHIKAHAPSMVLQYLEWIVLVGKDVTADFHNELIFIYLDTIVALKKDLAGAAAGGFAVMGTVGDLTPKTRAGAEGGLLGETRRKLVQFLETSSYYNPEKMLSRFPFNDLFEERALLLSRIGQHEQALNIYAHKLQDEQMAERYCERTYNPEQEDSRDVYLSLLKVYLRPPDDSIKPMVGPALALLNKYYKRIDAPKALELLPPNTSVHKLYPFFEAMLRDRTEVRHNNQVQKNLLKSETLQIKERLFKERQRSIRVTEDRNCPVCGKRLGTSVFVAYPNGTVVHYICFKDLAVCPVTGTRFGDVQ